MGSSMDESGTLQRKGNPSSFFWRCFFNFFFFRLAFGSFFCFVISFFDFFLFFLCLLLWLFFGSFFSNDFLFNFFFRFLFYLGRCCFGGFWSCDFNHDDVSESWIDLERGNV